MKKKKGKEWKKINDVGYIPSPMEYFYFYESIESNNFFVEAVPLQPEKKVVGY